MAQPDQGGQELLTDGLVGQAPGPPQLAQGARRLLLQAIVGHNGALQAPRQAGYQVIECNSHLGLLQSCGGVSKHWRARGHPRARKMRLGLFYRSPYRALDGWPGVSGKSGAALGIVAQDGTPEANAPRLQGIGIR